MHMKKLKNMTGIERRKQKMMENFCQLGIGVDVNKKVSVRYGETAQVDTERSKELPRKVTLEM